MGEWSTVLSSPLETKTLVSPSPSLRTVRLAVSAAFFVSGAVVASWVPHIPGMQQSLGLSPGLLGLVLLSPAIGIVAATILSGGLCARFGHAHVVRGATLAYACAAPLTVLAPHPLVLGLILAVMGLANGTLGVAMNAEAIEVERAYGRGINSSFHGLYSVGLLVGASLGGASVALGLPPVAHLLSVCAALGVLGVWASTRFLPHLAAPTDEQVPLFVYPTPFLALLGLGTFSSMLVEGAMADWSGIYMRDVLGVGMGLAASAFTAYSLVMVIARFTGDALNRRMGPAGLVRLGGALGFIGMALVIGLRQPWAALAGFGLVGAGMANVVPNFFRGSTLESRLSPSRSIAAVSSLGFAGFLVGPPLIGAIAQLSSLPIAMGAVAAFSALVFALAGLLKRPAQA